MNIILTIVFFLAMIWSVNAIEIFIATIEGSTKTTNVNYKLWFIGSVFFWTLFYYLNLIR